MARLLIVDNDERIVELSAWFFRRLGHAVDTANSYEAARVQLGKRWPDLMLADLDLGQERGQEELPKLANEGRLPATLVVSGFLDARLDQQLRSIPGVLGTVAKPVDLKQLEGLIQRILERAEGVPAPGPQEASGTTDPGAELGEEDGDADGWVEIAPLAPGIDPAPGRHAPWEDSPRPGRVPAQGSAQRMAGGEALAQVLNEGRASRSPESGPSNSGFGDPRTRL